MEANEKKKSNADLVRHSRFSGFTEVREWPITANLIIICCRQEYYYFIKVPSQKLCTPWQKLVDSCLFYFLDLVSRNNNNKHHPFDDPFKLYLLCIRKKMRASVQVAFSSVFFF